MIRGSEIQPGVYATIINVGINAVGLTDYSALVAQGVLPILTPQAVTVAQDLSIPKGQDIVAERVYQVLWKIPQGHLPKVALVGLPTNGTSIQAALNAAGLADLDITARSVLALPLYAFSVGKSNVFPKSFRCSNRPKLVLDYPCFGRGDGLKRNRVRQPSRWWSFSFKSAS